ncbi:MAG: C39 family peptidase, partial [Myxococcales bacterium]
LEHKHKRKLEIATDAYLEYLRLGGIVRYEELRPSLIRRFLNRGVPILTGLSATYLYRCAREHDDQYDDIRGEPVGHFVILSGYDRKKREVTVSDPSHDNPLFQTHRYSVRMDRLITSIALGVMTYDANLLVLTPDPKRTGAGS